MDKSILLVDDEEGIRKVLSITLSDLGYQVYTAENGVEALQVFEAKRPPIVLTDIKMPEMDGLEATATIRTWERSKGHHVPIIAMTAHAMKSHRELCLEAGMDDYVSKPIRLKELLGKLQEVMNSARGKEDHHP